MTGTAAASDMNHREAIVTAFMGLLAGRPLGEVTLADTAERAGLSLGQVRAEAGGRLAKGGCGGRQGRHHHWPPRRMTKTLVVSLGRRLWCSTATASTCPPAGLSGRSNSCSASTITAWLTFCSRYFSPTRPRPS
mgnify:CR=1 FL=1